MTPFAETPIRRPMRPAAALLLVLCVAACGQGADRAAADRAAAEEARPTKIWEIFTARTDTNATVAVNRYLWNASLEILNFLPIQSVDPFTGVIVTGYGTPPGGGRAYRATVKISDPALDARSLKLSLQGAGGSAVAPDTVRAVEDAILTRARQLRVRDARF